MRGGKRIEKGFSILISSLLVLFFSSLLYFDLPFLQGVLNRLNDLGYDVMLRIEHRPVQKETPIVIVDIDDRSIQVEGRWPWTRKRMGQLISQLYGLGAKVVALDIIFSETEENLVDQVIQEIRQTEGPSLKLQELEASKKAFDYDQFLAQELAKGDSILGFAFTQQGKPVGELPDPLMDLSGRMGYSVPEMPSYLSNIAIFQKASKGSGFINATLDSDGIIRFSPMLLGFQGKIYPSLSLAAVHLFLGKPPVKLILGEYNKETVIEGFQLGKIKIPTDSRGRILIPFRGPSFSIDYISATDLLSGQVEEKAVKDRLVFIGSSATASGDLVATAMAPAFVGVEIHAHIASGILEGYLPYQPVWEKGVKVLIILLVGGLLSFVLPFLGPIAAFLFTVFIASFLVYSDYYIWKTYQIVFSIVFPLLCILSLFIINEIAGYFLEGRRKNELKRMFGQYVPPEYLEQMLKRREVFGLEGESKELTVLFSDICHFAKIAEELSASDVKELLNDYLSSITEVIFKDKGTLDKYVGDMIMAFWGAPLDDSSHAEHAIIAAFDMHQRLEMLNREFAAQNRPKIEIGVGINTGVMNVGDMGSKYRKAYTVLGDAVNLGSRLESLTRVYNVKMIVGQATFEKTKSKFIFRFLDQVKVKGKEEAIQIYEPICKKEEETDEIRKKLQAHQKGIDAYLQRRWDEAGAIFEELKKEEPLYNVYLDRIAAFRSQPPPEGWDGTYAFEKK